MPRALKLAGKSLDLDGCKLRVGVSDTRALIPAATLHCRVVTTKNGDDPARFDAEIARQLATLDIRGRVFRVPRSTRPSVDRLVGAPRASRDPSRRIFRVKDKQIVGYSRAGDGTDCRRVYAVGRNAASAADAGWAVGVFVPVFPSVGDTERRL